MKTIHHAVQQVAIASLVLLALLHMPGCSGTPTQQWATEAIALNTAEGLLADLRETDQIDQDTFNQVYDTVVLPARAAVDQAETMLPEGGSAFEKLLAQVKAAVGAIKLADAESKAIKPTSAAKGGAK